MTIELDRVTWRYAHGDGPSLTDFSVSVETGEFLVLCGASGSGKSTALRLMNGLIPHFAEGELEGNVQVSGLVPVRSTLAEIGYLTGSVLQHPRRQFFTRTAGEEIAFASENFGTDPEEIRRRVEEQVQRLGFPGHRRVDTLSGGQQQQLAVSGAIAHRPGVLLLDEPSSNLSADAVDRLADTLAQLKRAGITIVVAEHRLRYLQALLDRVVVLREGHVDAMFSSEQFARVSDEDLAREGLRGAVSEVQLPSIPAVGVSVSTPGEEAGEGVGSSTEDVLELTGIRCRLGRRTVLDLDRAVFPAGRVTAIRGVNGAGKSTLVRIIAGLQRSEGVISLAGRTLNRRARLRTCAIVMQDVQRQLFTDSVAAEVGLSTDHESPQDPAAILDDLDLGHLADRIRSRSPAASSSGWSWPPHASPDVAS